MVQQFNLSHVGNSKSIVKNKVRDLESRLWLEFYSGHPNMQVAQACLGNVSPSKFWSLADLYPDLVSRLHTQVRLMGNLCLNGDITWLLNNNNKKRSHTQLDSRKQVIAFQDRVITINIKEAQHPLKREKQVIDKSSIMLKISTKSMHRVLV